MKITKTIGLALRVVGAGTATVALALVYLHYWAPIEGWITSFNAALLFIQKTFVAAYGPFKPFLSLLQFQMLCGVALIPVFYCVWVSCTYVSEVKRRRAHLRDKLIAIGPMARLFENPIRPWSGLGYYLHYETSSKLNRLGHQVDQRVDAIARQEAIRLFTKLAHPYLAILAMKRTQKSFLDENGAVQDGAWADDARDFIVNFALPKLLQHNPRLSIKIEVLATLLNQLIIPAGAGQAPDKQLMVEVGIKEDEHKEPVAQLLRAAG